MVGAVTHQSPIPPLPYPPLPSPPPPLPPPSPLVHVGYLRQWRVQAVEVVGAVTHQSPIPPLPYPPLPSPPPPLPPPSPLVHVGYLRQWRVQAVQVVGAVALVTHQLFVRLALVSALAARAELALAARVVPAVVALGLRLA